MRDMELIFTCDQEKQEATCTGISDKSFDGEVIVPGIYEGMPVVAIGVGAFKGSKISAVCIPRSVVLIGMQAFTGCDGLTEVTFETDSRLDRIAPMAFSGCCALTRIRLPQGLRVIEELAFCNCVCEIPVGCMVISPCLEGCRVISYEPDTMPCPPAPIEEDEKGNRFRLCGSGEGYVVERIRAHGHEIRVPERFNDLPVVALGNYAFSENDEAWRTVIPSTVRSAGYFPFYGCDEMGCAEYGGTVAEWREMCIYTWFPVYCADGTVEGHG